MTILWYMYLAPVLLVATANEPTNNPTANILIHYKKRQSGPSLLSSSSGRPVEYREATSTLTSNLLRNDFFLDSITHLDRERIPFRFVHALGNGPFGYFEVTNNITHICKAKLFSKIGKRTPLLGRFSLATAPRGRSDTSRDIRGLAVKFYTEEGNWDILALTTPTFVIKDPIFFTSFIHAMRPNPKNNLNDENTRWDFLTHRPESATFILNLFSNRGTPDGYRHAPMFTIHTYQVENENGDIRFVRFHLLPDAGIKNLRPSEAATLAGTMPDYSARDLYDAIENGNYPSWTMYIQVLSLEGLRKAKFDPFDMTKYLPEDDYPLHQVGRLVFNRNVQNYFAQMEQTAFCVGNLVPGILGAPDKIFEARILAYRDAQNYRLGVNFNKIKVNCPLRKPHTYNRDGRPNVGYNEQDEPNYFPNSFFGPEPYVDKKRSKIIELIEDEPDYEGNFEQARDYYRNYLSDQDREDLPGNIVASLSQAQPFLQKRALTLFSLIDQDLGKRIAETLNAHLVNSTMSHFN